MIFVKKIFYILILFFFTNNCYSIEFFGEFIQGHYIVGKTEANSKIKIDKKQVKVSNDGYFVFGLDRDRKFDVIITIKNSEKDGYDAVQIGFDDKNFDESETAFKYAKILGTNHHVDKIKIVDFDKINKDKKIREKIIEKEGMKDIKVKYF